MRHRHSFPVAAAIVLAAALTVGARVAAYAQSAADSGSADAGMVAGFVRDPGGAPLGGAHVSIEGTPFGTLSDSLGRYRLLRVPAGPATLAVRRIGYAPARLGITVRAGRVSTADVVLQTNALRLQTVHVTADPASRATGELGTADVIGRAAIQNQSASSLAGVLELVPGVPLQAPGLDNVQQIALRSVPTSSGGNPGASAAELAAFGTAIILDGVPLSNDANLQSTGPRGEFGLGTSAGGGIDLRRIPANTLERVEVIRGVPSARYGDLTQGVIVVDTRVGPVPFESEGRYDPHTAEASVSGGRALGAHNVLATDFDLARTLTAPGLRNDAVLRFAGQLAHRYALGGSDTTPPRLALDTRLNIYQLREDSPEDSAFLRGAASWNHDGGLRFSERGELETGHSGRLTFTGSVGDERQRSYVQGIKVRPATPFTDRLTPGRSTGHFVLGEYLARVHVDGDAWTWYGRLEQSFHWVSARADQTLRLGTELQRARNTGAGYTFDIEFPPQTDFNGVNGFDRPRRFDAVPGITTSAAYVDDRFHTALGPLGIDLQGGLRTDILYDPPHIFGAPRDVALEPRFNAQLTPVPWLRLRGGIGRTAKTPDLASLYPAPQYYDVVNVNWYTANPAERLAVLTTSMRNPTNPALRMSRSLKRELGMEVDLGHRASTVGLTWFSDHTSGGAGIREEPSYLLREHFQLTDSTVGTGVPPGYITPAYAVDTVPILIDQPANDLTLRTTGVELTASLPEIRALRTRLDVQGAWTRSEFQTHDLDFGGGTAFSDMQMIPTIPRVPYWEGAIGAGERTLLTWRAVHHEPELGLVATITVQQTLKETHHDIGPTDTLAFAGYVTRAGRIVAVPPGDRMLPRFADLRRPRTGILITSQPAPADWLLNFQVSKSIFGTGRLSFYAFNAFDRPGQFQRPGHTPRLYPDIRYGLELMLPLGVFGRQAGSAR